MSVYPSQVQRFHDVLAGLPGVRNVDLSIRSLAGLGEQELSFPGAFGDLPHLALRRTKGGLPNEMLVAAEVRFAQDFSGWITLEFLAWWVRDLSRSGRWVQMRPLALPPVAYGTQLGRTLKFVIEFFFTDPGEGNASLLDDVEEFADSLQSNVVDYASALANPTQAECPDLESLRRCADIGDASAQVSLGKRYAEGDGVKVDAAEAFRLYKKAARLGHPEAMTLVGLSYASGRGTAADPVKAAASYRKGAEGGWPLAMGLLAQCYEKGIGVPENMKKAAEWYQRGADAGELACLAELGECHELGKGVRKDLHAALKFYQQALDQGFDAVQPAIERVKSALEDF